MRIKKFILLGMLSTLLASAGCSGTASMQDVDFQSPLEAVRTRNTDLIARLANTGVINETSKNNKIKVINNKIDALEVILKDISAGNTSGREGDIKGFKGALSGTIAHASALYSVTHEYTCTCEACKDDKNGPKVHKVDGVYVNDDMGADTYIYPDQITQWKDLGGEIKNADDSSARAYEIFDESSLNALKDECEGYVYVLKKGLTQEQLQNFLEGLKQDPGMFAPDGTSSPLQRVNDSNGNGLHLFDFSDYDATNSNGKRGLLVDTSRYPTTDTEILGRRTSDAKFNNNTPNMDIIISGMITETYQYCDAEKITNADGTVDYNCKCEEKEKGAQYALYSLRIKEFNKDFVECVEQNFNTKDKFVKIGYKTQSGATTNCYALMEYPVEVIDSIEVSGSKWKANWKFSNHMYVNIYSGEMVYKTYDANNNELVSVVINKENDSDERLYKAYMNNSAYNTTVDNHLSFIPGEPINLRTIDPSTITDPSEVTQVKVGELARPFDDDAVNDLLNKWYVASYKEGTQTYNEGPGSLSSASPNLMYNYADNTVSQTSGAKVKIKTDSLHKVTLSDIISPKGHILASIQNGDYTDTSGKVTKDGTVVGNQSEVKVWQLLYCLSNYTRPKIPGVLKLLFNCYKPVNDITGTNTYKVIQALPISDSEPIRNYLSAFTLLKLLESDGIDLSSDIAANGANYRESFLKFWATHVLDISKHLNEYHNKQGEDYYNSGYPIYAEYKSPIHADKAETALNDVLGASAKKYIEDYQKHQFNRNTEFVFFELEGDKTDSNYTIKDSSEIGYLNGQMTVKIEGVTYYVAEVLATKTSGSSSATSMLDKNGNVRVDIETMSFRLTDYLELTYIPGAATSRNGGVLDDEPFIATGRRVTLTKFESESSDKEVNLEEVIGYYGNKQGDKLEINNGTCDVVLGDIIDYKSGDGDYEEVGLKLDAQTGKQVVPDSVANAGGNYAQAFKDEGISGRLSSSTGEVTDKVMLQYELYKDKINPVLQFTSESSGDRPALDGCDVGRVQSLSTGDEIKPSLYYGICIYTNPYTTGLYSQWIDLNVEEAGINGCLAWWNNWLASHNYYYTIDIENLKEMINGIYDITLADLNQQVIFDPITIEVINDDISNQKDTKIVNFLRTLEVLLGLFFIFYGLILEVAWVIDINITDGPGFLKILTGGKLHAVDSWDTDIPRSYNGEVNADFKYLTVLSICFIVVGIMLIIFDLYTIANMLIGFVNNLTEIIQNILHRHY